MALQAKKLFEILQRNLDVVNVPYKQVVHEFGQVGAWEQRENGKHFSLCDHVRGLILALLSAQRPWGPIARNMNSINKIFFDYDPEKIRKAIPSYFVKELCDIKCGNRKIVLQMNSLTSNINTFEKIEKEYNALDLFVISDSPNNIAIKLANPGSRFKLKEVGYPLAIEYLRNVGIPASKPDTHIRRLLSDERLGYFKGIPTEKEAHEKVGELAKAIKVCPTYLDNLLWLFCAIDYGNICGAKPRCNVCGFAEAKICNYPKFNSLK